MFVDKKKDKYIPPIRVTEEQKEIIDKMAQDREMTISKMILELLEIEYEEKRLLEKK